jgi:hypothetical protein
MHLGQLAEARHSLPPATFIRNVFVERYNWGRLYVCTIAGQKKTRTQMTEQIQKLKI